MEFCDFFEEFGFVVVILIEGWIVYDLVVYIVLCECDFVVGFCIVLLGFF